MSSIKKARQKHADCYEGPTKDKYLRYLRNKWLNQKIMLMESEYYGIESIPTEKTMQEQTSE